MSGMCNEYREKVDDRRDTKMSKFKKAIGWSVAFLFMVMIAYVLALEPPARKPNPNARYQVVLSNWLGRETHHCHHYKRDGNTWILFYQDGTVSAELSPTEGYVVRARRMR